LNEWRTRQGIDTRPGDDIYYKEYLDKYGNTAEPAPNPTSKLKAVV
jgi:hypothetical protein